MLWISVEIALIWRWKWNKIWRRFFNVAQRWYSVGSLRWNNVETTLHNVDTTSKQPCATLIQRCINIVLTSPQRCWNYIETNRAIEYGFVNRSISFTVLNETIFFYNMLLIQLLTAARCITIGNKVYIYESLKHCNLKTSKTPLKIWKCEISILFILKGRLMLLQNLPLLQIYT